MPEVTMDTTPDGNFIHPDWTVKFLTGKPGEDSAIAQLQTHDGNRKLPQNGMEYGKLKTISIPYPGQPGVLAWKSKISTAGTATFRPAKQAPVDFMTADAIRALVEDENRRKMLIFGGLGLAVIALLGFGIWFKKSKPATSATSAARKSKSRKK